MRVFDSSAGRSHLKVEPDPTHGLRGTTTKTEFIRGFKKLVTDVATGEASSRSLNKNEDIARYFRKWPASELPASKQGSFVPDDVVQGKPATPTASLQTPTATKPPPKPPLMTVLPTDLTVRVENYRLIDIRRELVKLRRKTYPNAGAVLLRVFLELAVTDYLDRTGRLTELKTALKKKGKLPKHESPTMRQLLTKVIEVAKDKLEKDEAEAVEKALKHDPAAPFSVSDLHSFVHRKTDIPGERDIEQFWLRTEALFRLMLEEDTETSP